MYNIKCITTSDYTAQRSHELWPPVWLRCYDWQGQRKPLENHSVGGGDNACLWRKYHLTMCCWAMLFDCKRRGWALIHAQAQNAGNANEQLIKKIQSFYSRTMGNGRIYVMNTTWCRSDVDLGDECIDLQHSARAAELLNPTPFFPCISTYQGGGRGLSSY